MTFLRKKQTLDSTAKGTPKGVLFIGALIALGMSAAAGAWVQSHWGQPELGLDQSKWRSAQTREQLAREDNMKHLAERIGDMQAKLIAMDGISKRVVQAAGLSYTDPEMLDAIEPMGTDLFSAGSDDGMATSNWGPDGLGERLDALSRRMSEQEDWFAMLDSVLTQRSGTEALLPNYRPLDSTLVSSSFGWRTHPISGRQILHEGVDFPAPRGTPIYAASGGVVTEARYVTGYGKMLEISHGNGLTTRYAHASSLIAKLGDVVEKGQMVARVGSTGQVTGSHLHFEVRMAGRALDPEVFLADRDPEDKRLAQLSAQD